MSRKPRVDWPRMIQEENVSLVVNKHCEWRDVRCGGEVITASASLFVYGSRLGTYFGDDRYWETISKLLRHEADETRGKRGAYCKAPDVDPELNWEAREACEAF